MRKKYTIVNKTKYPQREVRRLVEFAGRELDVDGTTVVVDYCRKRCGVANGFASSTHHVTVKVPSPSNPSWRSWRFQLLRIAAHELRHAHDRRHGGFGAWYGERTGERDKRGRRIRTRSVGIEREKKARAYEDYIVRKWQEKYGKLTVTENAA